MQIPFKKPWLFTPFQKPKTFLGLSSLPTPKTIPVCSKILTFFCDFGLFHSKNFKFPFFFSLFRTSQQCEHAFMNSTSIFVPVQGLCIYLEFVHHNRQSNIHQILFLFLQKLPKVLTNIPQYSCKFCSP